MNTQPLLDVMENWPPEKLLAVHEFCQLMSEEIWQQHSEQSIDYLRYEEHVQQTRQPKGPANQNLSLPFDDDLTF